MKQNIKRISFEKLQLRIESIIQNKLDNWTKTSYDEIKNIKPIKLFKTIIKEENQ